MASLSQERYIKGIQNQGRLKNMDVILIPLLSVLNAVIGIYVWIVIASVIMSWLINFNVINTKNNLVMMLWDFLYRITEPVFGKIRRFLPIVGGLDLSPLVLILVLWFVQAVIGQLTLKIALHSV